MAEELAGTAFDKGKGEADLSEVEDLIRKTLEESKRLERPAPQAAEEVKKEEFKATAFTAAAKPVAPKEKVTAAPAARQEAKPAEPSGYEATFKEYQVGDIVKGKVIKIDPWGSWWTLNIKLTDLFPSKN